MKLVLARARNDVDHAARGITELRRNDTRHNAELLHRVRLHIDGHLTQIVLQVRHAIEQVVIAPRDTARDTNRRGPACRGW